MMNSGRLFPGSSMVIEDVLRGESAEDAAALRPSLVQLRAAADRPVPVPSVQLQRLLDLSAGVDGAPTAVVTELDTFRAARASKGAARYGVKRRVAATSVAVMVLLGAGTGVAAAVDGDVRDRIVASVAQVAPVLKPAPAPSPAPVEPAVAAPAPEVLPEAPAVPVAAPAPVAAPPVEVVQAPAISADDAPGDDGADGRDRGHGNQADAGSDDRPRGAPAAASGSVAPGEGQGNGRGADVGPGTGPGNGRGAGQGNGQGQSQGAAANGAWVPPGQAKKAATKQEAAAEWQITEMLKHLKHLKRK